MRRQPVLPAESSYLGETINTEESSGKNLFLLRMVKVLSAAEETGWWSPPKGPGFCPEDYSYTLCAGMRKRFRNYSP